MNLTLKEKLECVKLCIEDDFPLHAVSKEKSPRL